MVFLGAEVQDEVLPFADRVGRPEISTKIMRRERRGQGDF